MRTTELIFMLVLFSLVSSCAMIGADSMQSLEQSGISQTEDVQGNYESIYSDVSSRARVCYSGFGIRPAFGVTTDVFTDRKYAEIRLDSGSVGREGLIVAVKITGLSETTSRVTVVTIPKIWENLARAFLAWSAGKSSECYPD